MNSTDMEDVIFDLWKSGGCEWSRTRQLVDVGWYYCDDLHVCT